MYLQCHAYWIDTVRDTFLHRYFLCCMTIKALNLEGVSAWTIIVISCKEFFSTRLISKSVRQCQEKNGCDTGSCERTNQETRTIICYESTGKRFLSASRSVSEMIWFIIYDVVSISDADGGMKHKAEIPNGNSSVGSKLKLGFPISTECLMVFLTLHDKNIWQILFFHACMLCWSTFVFLF